ncbi:unnamed protein product [Prunus armeniaca]|uniref:Amino acid transporter transmembrane domain-containing protein n=1 Tax=Prunus armeniaca TaxID=36596 RepID=A0A6J5WVZ6_PRUAR|nr:unnamed protein product [Prunus armeniaca]
MLSVPYALSSGGWLSLILLFVIAVAAFYTGLLIQRCMDEDSTIRTYPDIGERAFGKKGKIVLSIFMNTELYLVATAFLILEGDNLHNLFPEMKLQVAGLTISGKKCFTILGGLIVLPTVWFDSLSLLSYVSASGVFSSVIIIGSICGLLFLMELDFTKRDRVPYALQSMKNKRQFPNVLLVCFILCTLGYASMAVLGYLMFGSTVESQITLNLPTEELSSKIAIWTTLINPLSKYALMVTPILNTAQNGFQVAAKKSRSFRLFLSTPW